MHNHLQLDFQVNKENNTIIVKRSFAAHLPLVWKAWTAPEILDQWWAPSPWKAQTKFMNFREGGRWLYAMVSPEGEKHWSLADYISIITQQSFTCKDGFCDEQGNINPDMPQSEWSCSFMETNEDTTVEISIKFEKHEDLQATIEMGFEEGFTTGLQQLDRLLPSLQK